MDKAGKGTKEKTSKLRRIIQYSVATAAILLLIFLGLEVYKFYSLSADKLFNEKYEPYDLMTTRDTTESKIERAYREKKYSDVVKLNPNSGLSVNDVFLTGVAFLETGDYSKAISSFQVVISETKDVRTSVLKDAAEYYMALAYLQNHDYDEAIDLMNTIHDNPSHFYSERFSEKYINRIKRLKWR
ncbi:MAG TPA: tetratricopeptide repeat protein [Chitinophagaceae bacterium]|nr:tetratricopeptide repeat protein [Chitinophagaceae bacterium]